MIKLIFLLLGILGSSQAEQQVPPSSLAGAWELQMPESMQGLWIMDNNYFSITYYKRNNSTFISTEGGSWKLAKDGTLELEWEYNTRDLRLVGQRKPFKINLYKNKNKITVSDQEWVRLDQGTPGALNGTWLIYHRPYA